MLSKEKLVKEIKDRIDILEERNIFEIYDILKESIGEDLSKEYDKFCCSEDDKFVVFWNNRNARRKQTGSLILWFNKFFDNFWRFFFGYSLLKIGVTIFFNRTKLILEELLKHLVLV